MDSCGAAVSYVLWNHKISLWLPLKWITCRAHIVLNSLWHCNLVIIWLTDSDWLCIALSFLSWWPCPSVKAYQLSFGLAVCFGWLYKLNGSFKHADWSSCLSELFFTLYICEDLQCYLCTVMSTWRKSIFYMLSADTYKIFTTQFSFK